MSDKVDLIITGGVGVDDNILWHYEMSGVFSVKSGYRLLRGSSLVPSCSGLCSSISWWKWFWKLNVPSKIKIFLWKACNNWFPTRVNLASHGM